MRASVAAVFTLCVVAAIGGMVLGAGPAMAQSEEVSTDLDNISQTIEIQLTEDGDANVSVYKQLSLETEEDRAAFERLESEFEEGEASDELSVEVFEHIAESAANETDREMGITNVERETEATNSTGTLRLQFTWEGFANTEDDRIEVGDVFVIDGETWLPSLSDEQRLVVQAPEGYAVDTVDPETSVSGGTLVWEGPASFEPGELEATLVSSNPSEGFTLLTVGLGLGLVGVIVCLTYVLSRRQSNGSIVPTATADERGWASLFAPAADRSEGTQSGPSPTEAGTEPETGPEPDPFAGVNEELLSDDERVIRLLEVNDGRMKQATIVRETDWSNAKVSQILSAMEDRGEIEKLRIGRENLITLDEDE